MKKAKYIFVAALVILCCATSYGEAPQGYSTKNITHLTLQNELKTVTVTDGATTDSFTLTFGGQTTGALDWDCTAAEMEAALELLSTILEGQVSVTLASSVYTIEFTGTMASTNVGTLTSTGTGCTATIATTRAGGTYFLVANAYEKRVLHSILVGSVQNCGALIIYDGTDNTGTIIASIDLSISGIPVASQTIPNEYVLDYRMSNGIYIGIASATTVNITVSYF